MNNISSSDNTSGRPGTIPSTRKKKKSNGWLLAGGTFLVIGGLLMARQLGFDIPDWVFKWEMLVILFGLNVLIKSRFRDLGGLIVLGVGLFFLAGEIRPDLNLGRFAFPAVILTIGILIILTTWFPSVNKFYKKDADTDRDLPSGMPNTSGESDNTGYSNQSFKTGDTLKPDESFRDDESFRPGETLRPGASSVTDQTSPAGQSSTFVETRQPGQKMLPQYFREENLDIVSVFSANNKKVYSKNFIGGEVVCVFGGSELDLMNADITQGPIELEIVCIFGGATLFMPPNWLVISEMGSVFGGIDDKRKNVVPDQNKVITIKGVCIFGGLEIKSRGYN